MFQFQPARTVELQDADRCRLFRNTNGVRKNKASAPWNYIRNVQLPAVITKHGYAI